LPTESLLLLLLSSLFSVLVLIARRDADASDGSLKGCLHDGAASRFFVQNNGGQTEDFPAAARKPLKPWLVQLMDGWMDRSMDRSDVQIL
jgi:hypothetical protein